MLCVADGQGRTPLHFACDAGDETVMDRLIKDVGQLCLTVSVDVQSLRPPSSLMVSS
jgi:ankyrin repeat protein